MPSRRALPFDPQRRPAAHPGPCALPRPLEALAPQRKRHPLGGTPTLEVTWTTKRLVRLLTEIRDLLERTVANQERVLRANDESMQIYRRGASTSYRSCPGSRASVSVPLLPLQA